MNDFEMHLFEAWTKERLHNNFAVFEAANNIHLQILENTRGLDHAQIYNKLVYIEDIINNAGFENKREDIVVTLKSITDFIADTYGEYLP